LPSTGILFFSTKDVEGGERDVKNI